MKFWQKKDPTTTVLKTLSFITAVFILSQLFIPELLFVTLVSNFAFAVSLILAFYTLRAKLSFFATLCLLAAVFYNPIYPLIYDYSSSFLLLSFIFAAFFLYLSFQGRHFFGLPAKKRLFKIKKKLFRPKKKSLFKK